MKKIITIIVSIVAVIALAGGLTFLIFQQDLSTTPKLPLEILPETSTIKDAFANMTAKFILQIHMMTDTFML